MTAEQAVKSIVVGDTVIVTITSRKGSGKQYRKSGTVTQISGNIALVNVPGHLPQFVAMRSLTKVQPE